MHLAQAMKNVQRARSDGRNRTLCQENVLFVQQARLAEKKKI
jgi:hypothetical protein